MDFQGISYALRWHWRHDTKVSCQKTRHSPVHKKKGTPWPLAPASWPTILVSLLPIRCSEQAAAGSSRQQAEAATGSRQRQQQTAGSSNKQQAKVIKRMSSNFCKFLGTWRWLRRHGLESGMYRRYSGVTSRTQIQLRAWETQIKDQIRSTEAYQTRKAEKISQKCKEMWWQRLLQRGSWTREGGGKKD